MYPLTSDSTSSSEASTTLHPPAEPHLLQQPSAGFLTLPIEIRYDIYARLLCVPDYSSFSPSHVTSKDTVHANILLANRQINNEATAFLYHDNTFLAHPSLLTSFPRLRPHTHPVTSSAVLPRIRKFHLSLRLDCDPNFDAAAAEKSFSGLDELTVHVSQTSFLGIGCANLRRFEGVRGIGRVAIVGSTTGCEEYVAWLRDAMMSEPGTQVAEFVPTEPGAAYEPSIWFHV
jgi:hypothetical protein